MISLTSAQLDTWLAALIFPLVRILAMISTSPVLGNQQVPKRVKIGLSVLLALVVAPTIPDMSSIPVGSPQGLLIIIQQIIIGVAMGFTMRLIFTTIEMAGELAGLQMGLGFASFFDPVNSAYSPIVARWLGMVAILAFLAADWHLYMLSALAQSFVTLPIGGSMSDNGFYSVAGWGASIFAFGLQIAMPIVAALLFTNIALGILTRTAPQLNLFAVGFPITLTIGFMVLVLSLPYFIPLFDRLVQDGLSTMLGILTIGQR
jgi:flagellar biosynthetic protein FliR